MAIAKKKAVKKQAGPCTEKKIRITDKEGVWQSTRQKKSGGSQKESGTAEEKGHYCQGKVSRKKLSAWPELKGTLPHAV